MHLTLCKINPPKRLEEDWIPFSILQSFPGGEKRLGLVCVFFSSQRAVHLESSNEENPDHDGSKPCKHVLRHGGNHKEIDLLVAVWTMPGGLWKDLVEHGVPFFRDACKPTARDTRPPLSFRWLFQTSLFSPENLGKMSLCCLFYWFSYLACVNRDELKWAAWMTCFLSKWRAKGRNKVRVLLKPPPGPSFVV